MTRKSIICAFLWFGVGASLMAQQVPVQEYVLDNGMKLLMVPRKGDPNIAAGWIAKVGSVNEHPGITGISHLFEHMMFKGTRILGTTNIQEDLKTMEQMDVVRAELRKEEQNQMRRLRLGEISDSKDPKNRTPRHQQLLDEFSRSEKVQKDLLVKNEFDKIYTAAGCSGMNAFTTNDFTVYFINVPANKLELWFWMESDRLLNPVFREFYAERDVVHEERRMRTDSTPTGKFHEQFEAMFWTSSPYSWPVLGWPSDLEGLTREEAVAYFAVNYAPNNLTTCLVGDFEPARARALADRYFGRLKRNPQEQLPVRTREVEQHAEKRMIAFAETNPEVQIRYHTVADGHKEEPALVVLGSLLSGRTGRLYKSLVLDRKIASNVFAGQNGMKWQGYFSLHAVAKPGNTPEQVEQIIYREMEKLRSEKVGERELQKVKNRFAADDFRRLQNNFALMVQLLMADANRGWQAFNEDPKRIEAVIAEDIQRVANQYFKPEKRAVAVYYTKKAEEADPLLTGLSDQDKAQIQQFRGILSQLNAEQAKMMLQQVEQQEASAPPDKKNLLHAIKKLIQEKLGKGSR